MSGASSSSATSLPPWLLIINVTWCAYFTNRILSSKYLGEDGKRPLEEERLQFFVLFIF
jgi:hypothetical protein